MKRIAIIGGGFTGTMTAVQLIELAKGSLEILLINEQGTLNRGIAYNPYSEKHLLNVIAGKMSAYPNQPNHFLDWVMEQPQFISKDRTLISNAYLPRRIYGDYLMAIWENALKLAASKNIQVEVIQDLVTDLFPKENKVTVSLCNNETLEADVCVIASGNNIPRNPTIKNTFFFNSKNYFQNPWKKESVESIDRDLPVLIIGNGLTMVDTVLGLLEEGFNGEIYSISPNGFNILPHRHNGFKYTKLTEEINEDILLFDLVKKVIKHIKTVREYGVTAEPVIDSLRPHTQRIWKNLTATEKQLFMSRFRHLWGVARHRIPLHTHDKIQQLRIEGKLHINSGKIIDFTESEKEITLTYFDKKEQETKELKISRVINCTGPETNLKNLDQSFLKNCLLNGILTQDSLNLGIKTNTATYQVLDSNGVPHKNLFTIGSSLKGELWESTAVNELRMQAKKLADQLLRDLKFELTYLK
tara:strand:+ start:2805 stop:4217 length:1413 start_codon:yes stop_codon:yes gene_type:complete